MKAKGYNSIKGMGNDGQSGLREDDGRKSTIISIGISYQDKFSINRKGYSIKQDSSSIYKKASSIYKEVSSITSKDINNLISNNTDSTEEDNPLHLRQYSHIFPLIYEDSHYYILNYIGKEYDEIMEYSGNMSIKDIIKIYADKFIPLLVKNALDSIPEQYDIIMNIAIPERIDSFIKENVYKDISQNKFIDAIFR